MPEVVVSGRRFSWEQEHDRKEKRQKALDAWKQGVAPFPDDAAPVNINEPWWEILYSERAGE